MLRCASVYTYEIDEPEVALREIQAQLGQKLHLLENSVGIVMCHPDFISSGTLKHLAENLPFDLVGATTSSQAVNDEAGEFILTILVLTADDVRFVTGVTGELDEELNQPVKAAYDQVTAGITEQPKLALIFLPLFLKYAGDAYLGAWRQVVPNTPLFGTIATDDTLTFEDSATIYNGAGCQKSLPFVLCYGAINPRFIVGTLPQDHVMPYKGEVTKAEGPFVAEINNINAYKYFESIGFASNGALAESYIFVPFVIDQKKRADYDGIPVFRGHASFTGDGTAIFRGDVDQGSVFTMLNTSTDDVLSVTREKLEQINAMEAINGVLLLPCIVRRLMTMHVGHLVELETIRAVLKPEIPYMAGYSGGEICPTSINNGVPTNRFHNYSLVILIV